jgi:hypothetical protein
MSDSTAFNNTTPTGNTIIQTADKVKAEDHDETLSRTTSIQSTITALFTAKASIVCISDQKFQQYKDGVLLSHPILGYFNPIFIKHQYSSY